MDVKAAIGAARADKGATKAATNGRAAGVSIAEAALIALCFAEIATRSQGKSNLVKCR